MDYTIYGATAKAPLATAQLFAYDAAHVLEARSRGYKTFLMLNSAEHEI